MALTGTVDPSAEVSSSSPPWTERHEREAFVRLCELAIEATRARNAFAAHWLAFRAGSEGCKTESRFRLALRAEAEFETMRIDAEVALVRQRADAPPNTILLTADEPQACDVCGTVQCLCAGEG